MTDRKFADWEWRGNTAALEAVGQGIIKLEVRMRWGSDKLTGRKKYHLDDITNPKQAPIFFIKHPDPFIEIESGDISELAKMARELLEEWFKIDWKPKLVVAVTASTSIDQWDRERGVRMNSGFEMSVSGWDEGVQSKTGRIFRREHDRWGEKRHKYAGDIKSSREGKSTRADKITVAVIDDTPENRKALEDMSAGLNDLMRRLQQFLRDDNLQQTLADAAFRKLLPEVSD